MLSYLKQNKGKVSHVVVSELSRLSRSMRMQSELMDSRFKDLGVKLAFTTENGKAVSVTVTGFGDKPMVFKRTEAK